MYVGKKIIRTEQGQLFYRDIPRPVGCGISPLKFEIAP